jgi:hypothetical protein
MAVLLAHAESDLDRNRRHISRWPVQLGTKERNSGADLTIHNLSTTGLLVEAHGALSCGDELLVDLPECGEQLATVLWDSAPFFGCSFQDVIPAAAVSAVLLKSPPVKARRRPISEPKTRHEWTDDEDPADILQDCRLPLRTRALSLLGRCAGGWALVGFAAWAML